LEESGGTFEKRLSSWKGKNLSLGGRLTLINSVLSSLPMYMMSFFSIPKGVLKRLDYFRSRFFWQNDEQKRKYRLAKWDILCQPKEQGGLGIHNLKIKNIALLSKWLYKLLTSDGTWQQILRIKYLGSKPISQVQWKNGDSHFWASLMKVKQDFLRFGTYTIKNGSRLAGVWSLEPSMTPAPDLSSPSDTSHPHQPTPASTPGPASEDTSCLPIRSSPSVSGGRSCFERWLDTSPRTADSGSLPRRVEPLRSYCEVVAAKKKTAAAPSSRTVRFQEQCEGNRSASFPVAASGLDVPFSIRALVRIGEGWQVVESKWSKRRRLKLERQIPRDLVGRCFNCLSQDHFAFQCVVQKTRCFWCRELGHHSFECTLFKEPVWHRISPGAVTAGSGDRSRPEAPVSVWRRIGLPCSTRPTLVDGGSILDLRHVSRSGGGSLR
jgi:hypothetical protein